MPRTTHSEFIFYRHILSLACSHNALRAMKYGSCTMDHKSNLFWNSCILVSFVDSATITAPTTEGHWHSNFYQTANLYIFWTEKSFCFSTKRLRFAACRFSFTLRWSNRGSNSEAMRFWNSFSKSVWSKFKTGNQLNAGVPSQSASSTHVLLITKSRLKKCPLSQPISIQ